MFSLSKIHLSINGVKGKEDTDREKLRHLESTSRENAECEEKCVKESIVN